MWSTTKLQLTHARYGIENSDLIVKMSLFVSSRQLDHLRQGG